MENEAVKTPHLQGLAGTVLERLIQFPYTLILDVTLSTSGELGTVKPIHQHFSLGQFVPKLRPLGRRQLHLGPAEAQRQRVRWGEEAQQSE